LGAKYSNFETLNVADGVSVDLDNIAGITAVGITAGVAATGVTDLTATQAAAVTMIAGNATTTIGVKGATTVGQIDTVKITYSDGDSTLNEDINGAASNLTLAGVENLEVTSVDAAEIVQSAATSGSLTSVKLFGAGNHSFTTGNMATSNFTLDASGSTGTNTLDASTFETNGVSITGGSGADTITGSGQADVIIGGAGNDTITGGDGTDTVTGGAGADTFAFAADDNAGADGAAVADKITDFVAGTDKLQFTGFADVVSGQQAAVQAAVTALAAGSTDAQIATAMANARAMTESGVLAV
jgi:Ca2+-binding RTX toxin-like protein